MDKFIHREKLPLFTRRLADPKSHRCSAQNQRVLVEECPRPHQTKPATQDDGDLVAGAREYGRESHSREAISRSFDPYQLPGQLLRYRRSAQVPCIAFDPFVGPCEQA
jgi:hypothetical protein